MPQLGLMIAALVAGLVVLSSHGFPSRLPEASLRQMKALAAVEAPPGCPGVFPSQPEGCRAHVQGSSHWTLLLGDSHAAALFPGIVDRDVVYVGNEGCPPGPELDTTNLRDWTHPPCLQVNRRAWELVTSDPRFDTVVLAFRGAMYVTGEGFGESEQGRYAWQLRYRGSSTESNAAAFEAALDDGLARIVLAKKHPVILLQVPELGFSPLICLERLRPFDFWKPKVGTCGVLRATVERRQASYRAIIARLTAKHPETQLIDPLDSMCDREWCYAKREDVVRYSDDDHLSPSGAEELWKRSIEPASAAKK